MFPISDSATNLINAKKVLSTGKTHHNDGMHPLYIS